MQHCLVALLMSNLANKSCILVGVCIEALHLSVLEFTLLEAGKQICMHLSSDALFGL